MSAPATSSVPQPASFIFTQDNMERVKGILAKYPDARSAVMPLLHLAQDQNGNWLPKAAMDHVADMLKMPAMKVYEMATFYTMYNLSPVGKHLVQVCTTTPCWLRGSDDIVAACRKKLGVNMGETTPDGQFTLAEVECLGACVNAPMVQIGNDFYEDLTPDSMTDILEKLARGEKPKTGSQTGRQCSAPEGVVAPGTEADR
ncbi:MAG: NADH-quinone oxidoreductase subunit NuoE [Pseudomonadota bacterium]|nr:NADH-quinone oxidoreductase subunit NuoE [Pseudomonadota bacterium]